MGLTVAVGLLSLASCDQVSNKRGADGYYFEQESFVRTKFSLEVVLVQTPREMADYLKEREGTIKGDVKPEDVAAFAVISEKDTTCTIYIMDPKVSYQPEFIGHELVHCIYGVWHDEPQKSR
jgi:hypothetical protein